MMRKNGLIFLLIGAILLSCCSCGPAAPKEIWDVQQYEEHEDIIRIRKLNIKQVFDDGVPVTTYRVTYQSDDCEVNAFLAVPNSCIEEKKAVPCIIYNRGGNKNYGINMPQDIAAWAELSECVEKLKRETRRYAKRQMTWFRKDMRINRIFSSKSTNYEKILEIAENLVKKYSIL